MCTLLYSCSAVTFTNDEDCSKVEAEYSVEYSTICPLSILLVGILYPAFNEVFVQMNLFHIE